ncbi:MAG TPA: hypothetical protein VKA84_16080 [Gemmatimonadaceae bacterium]|nr:hypothetical protein [Gemmatimonadaceae bacterium]
MTFRDPRATSRKPYERPSATIVRLDPTRELLQGTACNFENPDNPACVPPQGSLFT